jgi:hypothetical protein
MYCIAKKARAFMHVGGGEGVSCSFRIHHLVRSIWCQTILLFKNILELGSGSGEEFLGRDYKQKGLQEYCCYVSVSSSFGVVPAALKKANICKTICWLRAILKNNCMSDIRTLSFILAYVDNTYVDTKSIT